MVTAVVTTTTYRAVARADDGARRYGDPTDVVVARHDLAAGTAIGAGDVAVRTVPAANVPPGALAAAPIGRVTRRDVDAGEVVTDRRLAPARIHALTAAVGPGRRGVAVPRGDHPLPVRPGDRVDVIGPDGTAVAAAEVVAVDRTTAVVAIAERDAPAVVAAVAGGGTDATATLTLRGA